MTLIELIATIVVTGIMAAAGTAALNTVMDHRKLAQESTTVIEGAAATRSLISDWLSAGAISIQMGGGPRVRARQTVQSAAAVTAAVASGDELNFSTAVTVPFGSAPARVRLYADDDPNTPEQGLTVEFQGSTSLPLQRMQIDSSITMMTVEILDGRTNRWFRVNEGASVQVIAVRVTLGRSDEVPLQPLLTVPIVVRQGDGAASVWIR